MTKKIYILSIILVAVVSTACNNKAAAPKNYTLNYWGLFEPAENIQPFIDEYKKSHPNITIIYTQKGLKEYRQQVQSRAGKENGPDIFRYHNSWVPELKKFLAVTPENVTNDLNFQKTFYPVMHTDLSYNRGYLGIPLMYDGLVLYYNKRIFQQGGISKPPEFWGNVLDTAEQLKAPKSGPLEIAGIAMGTYKNIDYWPDILSLLMEQSQANIKAPLSTKENSETALNFFRRPLIDKLWDDTWPNATESFAQEKLAMMFGVSWTAFEIQGKNPRLDFASVPVPQLPGSKVGLANYWIEGVAASSDADKKAEAWKFLAFLASKENQKQMYATQAKTRLFGEPYSRTDLAAEVENNQYVNGILDTAPQARSTYMSDKTYGGGINDELKSNYLDLLTGKRGIKDSDKKIQETFKKYGIDTKQN